MSAEPAPSLILGNWKMHFTVAEAEAFLRGLLPRLRPAFDREIAVAPPFTALAACGALIAGSAVRLAAQNVSWEDSGAFTGEISPTMLQDLRVAYVIIGHSERRRHFGETDLMVRRKLLAALRAEMRPVVCVGEEEQDRAAGRAASVVRGQVARALEGVPPARLGEIAVAYEPVWAIGTGKAATPSDVAEMHAVVASEIEREFGAPAAERVRILYGGSVTPGNVDALMATPRVRGVLVGGAAIRHDDFSRIAAYR